MLGPGMAAAALASCGAEQLAAMAVTSAFVLGSSSSCFCWEARAALSGAPARALVEALNVRRRLMIAVGRGLSPARSEWTAAGAVHNDEHPDHQGPDVCGDGSRGQAEAGSASATAVEASPASAAETAGSGRAAAAEGTTGKRGRPAASKARAMAAKTAKKGAVETGPVVWQHRRRKRASGVTRAAL